MLLSFGKPPNKLVRVNVDGVPESGYLVGSCRKGMFRKQITNNLTRF